MNKQDNHREAICDLTDGQLTGNAFDQTIRLIHADADARRTWQAYHVVGDVLRSQDLAGCSLGDGFISRFQARLQKEEALSAPAVAPVVSPVVVSAEVPAALTTVAPFAAPKPEVTYQAPAAANDPAFRWKLVAGFASLVAVGAIGWNMLGSLGAEGKVAPVMALAAPSVQVVADPGQAPMVMIRDPNLDALLAAHKQFGNGNALQGSTGFLRNATFEGPAR